MTASCWASSAAATTRASLSFSAPHNRSEERGVGGGEILLNCIDKDGTNSGFDLELIKMVKEAVTIPVIASSGAGKPEHFAEVFAATGAEAAALAAGIFHRHEVDISAVKEHLRDRGIETRS